MLSIKKRISLTLTIEIGHNPFFEDMIFKPLFFPNVIDTTILLSFLILSIGSFVGHHALLHVNLNLHRIVFYST